MPEHATLFELMLVIKDAEVRRVVDALLKELLIHNPQRDSYMPRYQEYSVEAIRWMVERAQG